MRGWLAVFLIVGGGLASAAPPAPAPLEVRLAEVGGRGLELRVAVVRLRGAEPFLRACAEKAAAPVRGALNIAMRIGKRGEPANVAVTGPADAAFGECVAAALRGLVFAPSPRGSGELSATVIVRPAVDESALPELASREELSVKADASCEGVERFDCPPNKDCMAPRRRAVRCPVEHGLPARLPLGDRRLVLEVSGGKTGQLGERLTLADGGGQCVLVVQTNVGAGPLDGRAEQREDVDVPCVRARALQALAARTGLTRLRAPRAISQAHEVTHRWALWQPRKNRAPVVREGAWTGASPRADAVFAKVAAALGALASEHAKLALSRLGP